MAPAVVFHFHSVSVSFSNVSNSQARAPFTLNHFVRFVCIGGAASVRHLCTRCSLHYPTCYSYRICTHWDVPMRSANCAESIPNKIGMPDQFSQLDNDNMAHTPQTVHSTLDTNKYRSMHDTNALNNNHADAEWFIDRLSEPIDDDPFDCDFSCQLWIARPGFLVRRERRFRCGRS